MKEIEFVKVAASGNDFIIIDCFKKKKPAEKNLFSKLAKQLCRRKMSVGADGLLVIEPSRTCDFKMRIFNPDGQEAQMCGNGSRCAALYAANHKICASKMSIQTQAGSLEAQVKANLVKIKMPLPKDLRLKFDLDINGKKQNVNYINTGVPHLVCFAEDLDNLAVAEIGRQIRYHPEFQPAGANADFVQVFDQAHIRLRTYERGVEEETLSCGTGAAAAGIITAFDMQQNPKGNFRVKVDTQSKESLNIYFSITNGLIEEVYLEGEAKIVYQGLVY